MHAVTMKLESSVLRTGISTDSCLVTQSAKVETAGLNLELEGRIIW